MKTKGTAALLAAAVLLCLSACAVNGPYDALSDISAASAQPTVPAVEVVVDPIAEPTPEPTEEPETEPTEEPETEPTPEPTPKPTPEPSEEPEAEPTPKPTKEPEAEPTPEPTGEPEAEPTPEPTGEPEAKDGVFGTVDGNVYDNEYFGLRCTLPEDWAFLSDEQLDEKVDSAVEDPIISGFDSEIQAFVNTDGNGCAAAAASEDGLKNFNIVIQYLSGWGRYISEGDMCQIALHQLGVPEDGDLSALGLEGSFIRKNTVRFCGEEHDGLLLEYTDTSLGIEIPIYLQFVYVIGDAYAMQITMGSNFDQAGLDEIAALFAPRQQ